MNGAPLAYLDNAATTQMPLAVLGACGFDAQAALNIHRGVHAQPARHRAFEQARATLKRFVGAGAEHELVFTSGTTRSLNMVAHGPTPGAAPAALQPGDEIIVSGLEHHANLVPWQPTRRACGGAAAVSPDAQGPPACRSRFDATARATHRIFGPSPAPTPAASARPTKRC